MREVYLIAPHHAQWLLVVQPWVDPCLAHTHAVCADCEEPKVIPQSVLLATRRRQCPGLVAIAGDRERLETQGIARAAHGLLVIKQLDLRPGGTENGSSEVDLLVHRLDPDDPLVPAAKDLCHRRRQRNATDSLALIVNDRHGRIFLRPERPRDQAIVG